MDFVDLIFLDANSSLIVFLMLSNVFCIQGRRDRCICYTIQRLRRPCSPYWKLPLVHRTPMATRRWPWWPTTCSTCWCSNCPIFTRRRSRQKSNRAGRVSRLEISSWNSALSPWDRRSRAFSSRYVLHPYISFHSPLLCLLWDIICAFHPGPTFFISRSNPKWWTDMLRPLPIKTAGPGRPYKAGENVERSGKPFNIRFKEM